MCDVGSTPSTEIAGDRVLCSARGSIKAMVAQLQTSVSALKNPQLFTEEDFGALCVAQEELSDMIEAVRLQQEAVLNPPPEETPLIFDDLVHTLSFLTAKDLGSAVQVSRHFRRAAEPAVRHGLDHFGGLYSCFEDRYHHIIGVPLLARIEHEFERLPEVLAKITCGLDEDLLVPRDLMEELEDMDHNVIFIHMDKLWEKLDELKDGEEGAMGGDLRGDLLSLLDGAGIPEKFLAEYVKYPMYELNMRENCGRAGLHSLRLMGRMPGTTIEKHVDTLMWWLTSDKYYCAELALEAVERIGLEKLSLLKLKAKIATAPTATSSKHAARSARDKFIRLLEQLPE